MWLQCPLLVVAEKWLVRSSYLDPHPWGVLGSTTALFSGLVLRLTVHPYALSWGRKWKFCRETSQLVQKLILKSEK